MVVCFHAIIYYFSVPEYHTMPDWAYYGAAGVDLFFVISGFVMVHVTQHRFGSLASQLDFLHGRITRIYPPYWVATLPVIVACLLFSNGINLTLNSKTLFTSFFLFPTGGFPLLRVGWSLIHEIYFYVVFSFFLLGKRESLGKKLLFWALLILGAAVYLPASWRQIPLVNLIFNPFTLEFIAGCFLGLLAWPKNLKYGPLLMVGGFILLMGGTLLMPEKAPVTGDWRPLFLGVPAFLIASGALAMEHNAQILSWSLLQRLGDASFQIYLWHNTVVSAISRYSLRFAMPNSLRCLLTIVCGVTVGYLAHLYIEKPLLRLTRNWHMKRPLPPA
jgi:peptidoglycan/LPS O-acetylase OafA/YrhL